MKKKTLNSKISQVFENMMIRITKLISSIRNKNNTFLKTKQFEQALHSNKHCILDEICNKHRFNLPHAELLQFSTTVKH